ncbi:MAG: SHOCT domain-containing protein [Acidimicrobiales bacterium]|nr:SHOCT domain-containing protein [Acidimicrobiales bacterium]
MLLFNVFGDLFRDRSLSGIAKAAWILFLIVTPYLGVFVYLIARGGSMAERQMAQAEKQEAAVRQYIQGAAGTTSVADEITRLAQLKDQGLLTEAEFTAQKAKLLA